MDISVTTDMELVKSIIFIPEIWNRAAEDGIDKERYEPYCDEMRGWLVCRKGDDITGIILVHYDTSTSLKIHPYLKKEFRFLGRDMMKEFYKCHKKTLAKEILFMVRATLKNLSTS